VASLIRTKPFWLVLLGLVAMLAGGSAIFSRVTASAAARANEPASLINAHAPEFSLASLDHRTMSLADARGQMVVVNFWATWCISCRAEMKEFERVYETYRDQGLLVLAVDESESEEVVAAFAREYALTFPILLDSDGAVMQRYRVLGLPTTFFVGRDGVISAARIGELDRDYVESQIARLGVTIHLAAASPEPSTQDLEAPDWRPQAAAPTSAPKAKLNLDDYFPPGKGHDLVVQTCLTCHEVLTFGLARKSEAGWMRNRASHANRFPSLSDTQVELMYEYLVANLNPDFPIPQDLPLGYSCGT
jgi:peroxiredoxin